VKSFLVLFFKKEPLAFWAGTEATPIPQESGSRPVGIIQLQKEMGQYRRGSTLVLQIHSDVLPALPR
jgi:hypothetical protein